MPVEIIPGLDRIQLVLQSKLGGAWRDAVAAIVNRWADLDAQGMLNANSARQALQQVLIDWPTMTASAYGEAIDQLFSVGFAIGVADTGVRAVPDAGDEMALKWIKEGPHGFIPALNHLASDGKKNIEKVISEAYKGRDEVGEPAPFDLDDMVRRITDQVDIGHNRAELIVRTETAKVTALGRITAWGGDSYRNHYDYLWIATPDDRTKDVSLKFEREGPYTWQEIKHRWEVDHNEPQLVRNRRTGDMEHQVSAFNCRCTVARVPKEPEELLHEGLISQEDYEAMVL